MITEIVNKALIVIGIIFAYFVLKKLLSKAGHVIPAMGKGGKKYQEEQLSEGERARLMEESEEKDVPPEKYISKLSGEAKAKLEAKEQMVDDITDFVDENPEEAANLVSTWLNQDQMEEQEGG